MESYLNQGLKPGRIGLVYADLVLCQIRSWRRDGCLTESAYSVLLSVLMRAVERVSNTQGTYHDFPRATTDSRALNPLRLDAPAFDSTFCKKAHFIGELGTLVKRAHTRLVALSYFDGRNHWNDFEAEANGIGYQKLLELFTSGLFLANSLSVIPIPRLNYQSYGGHKAREILEYLFIAEKATDGEHDLEQNPKRTRIPQLAA